ncbi:UNKNOWN [Stylonychia lemnae]|uniref:Uncharacterized protein n=1 Tax=Stylonychia lemnae TaxID=5949 RepID=A0A078AKK6_STYLE|nr:UNKNOWN [Stylonychia lemnae]|eukprot:CDW82890.1 UNKNOWN [Stylonychia lemnae]
MDAIVLKSNIFGFIKTKTGVILGFYYQDPITSTSVVIQRMPTNTMIYGISSEHFSYKEPGDIFESNVGPFPEVDVNLQVVTTPRARLGFHPSCINHGMYPNQAQCYSSSNFNQPEYCEWILLKPSGDSNPQFDCEQIEYYQGNLQ